MDLPTRFPLPYRALLPLALATLLATPAQAAEIRLGLSAAPTAFLTSSDPTTTLAYGVSLSNTWARSRSDFRASVSIEQATVTNFRTDLTWLSKGETYYGAGVGTGVFASSLFYVSPIVLANMHGVVGKNFGPLQVEGRARLGLASSAGVSVSYLLNP